MEITVGGVLTGLVFGLLLGSFQLYALWRMVSYPSYRWLWFIGKMLAYVVVFTGMTFWSVGHLAGCAGASLFLLFAGAAVIFTKAKRSN